MSKVLVTLEFNSIEEAIASLGRQAGISAKPAAPQPIKPVPPLDSAPPAAKPPRKPRADAGQPRGPYNKNAAGVGSSAAGASSTGNGMTGTTDASKAGEAATSTSTTPAAPAGSANSATPSSAPAAPQAVPTQEDVQAAVEKLFGAGKFGGYENTAAVLSRFGVKRGKDIAREQRAEFLRRAADITEGKYQATDTWPVL